MHYLLLVVVLACPVHLTDEQQAELRTLTNSPGVAATVTTRARIVLGHNEGRQKDDVAALDPAVAGAEAGGWIVGARHGGGAERTLQVRVARACLARLNFASGFVVARGRSSSWELPSANC